MHEMPVFYVVLQPVISSQTNKPVLGVGREELCGLPSAGQEEDKSPDSQEGTREKITCCCSHSPSPPLAPAERKIFPVSEC